MIINSDWLPTRREDQLAMAKDWLDVASRNATAWNIPAEELSALADLISEARSALNLAESGERTPVVTANCKARFVALVKKMRFIKRRYFISPPLTDTDFVSLRLKPRARTRTPVPPPTAQADADISRPGVHLLELRLRSLPGSEANPHRSDYGFRVYYGIMPQGGATVEAATGMKRELMKVPVSGKELPFSKFTRRKKHLFNFAQDDSAKTVYFCVCYENAKGDSGPWGPVFSSVIP